MTFGKTYDKTKPQGGDLVSEGDDFLRNQWEAIEERQKLEHILYTDSGTSETAEGAAGMHKPGFVSAVKKASLTSLESIADLPGRLGLDTTNDLLVVNNGNASTGWTSDVFQKPTGLGVLAFYAHKTSDQTSIATGAQVTFEQDGSTYGFDYGTDFNTTTSAWVAPFNCIYQMDVQVYWSVPIGGQGADIRFRVNTSTAESYVGQPGKISGLFKFDSGDSVKVHVNYHTTGDLGYSGNSGTIKGVDGAMHTYWSGYCVARL